MKKNNYQVKFQEGSFDNDGDPMVRVNVFDGTVGAFRKKVPSFNQEVINTGFGTEKQDAINDFINRNKSDVLNMIFDI